MIFTHISSICPTVKERKKNTGNVASAQNGRARTIVSRLVT